MVVEVTGDGKLKNDLIFQDNNKNPVVTCKVAPGTSESEALMHSH